MGFTLTEPAQRFIQRVVRLSGGGGGFRLMVKPGGCAGLTAKFGAAQMPDASEKIVKLNGIILFLNADTRILLEGVTVDFADTAHETGFKFYDSKATGLCTPSAASAH